ncbi:hypothetical protein SDC9_118638 [bioreactor metagenome]|uniref:Uncharacterized protein n=1 Tax=bioreactor metagenome TaxID=1076179 RepID=A0A645C2T3_9ZZZZ
MLRRRVHAVRFAFPKDMVHRSDHVFIPVEFLVGEHLPFRAAIYVYHTAILFIQLAHFRFVFRQTLFGDCPAPTIFKRHRRMHAEANRSQPGFFCCKSHLFQRVLSIVENTVGM